MTKAHLNISVIPKRMLTQTEAAEHCGRSYSQFKRECPVTPVQFQNGDLRWDIRDLDAWIDSLKSDDGFETSDMIIARLA